MRSDELKVYYKGKHDKQLDDALIECLRKFGYNMWASGYNLVDGIRDLAFDMKRDENGRDNKRVRMREV